MLFQSKSHYLLCISFCRGLFCDSSKKWVKYPLYRIQRAHMSECRAWRVFCVVNQPSRASETEKHSLCGSCTASFCSSRARLLFITLTLREAHLSRSPLIGRWKHSSPASLPPRELRNCSVTNLTSLLQ